MIIDISRRVLEQLVKDKVFMYRLVNNWAIETNEHYSWYGIGLHYEHKHLSIRPRGHTQISITYEDRNPNYGFGIEHIEKRILKYKKL